MNSQRVHVHSKTSIRSAGPGHSFVEGETYDDRFSEIEAMGGDPFFMDEEEKSEEQVSDERVKMAESQDAATLLENSHLGALLAKAGARSATDGKGPTPKESNTVAIKEEPDWEWDGTVDEDAHLGFD